MQRNLTAIIQKLMLDLDFPENDMQTFQDLKKALIDAETRGYEAAAVSLQGQRNTTPMTGQEAAGALRFEITSATDHGSNVIDMLKV